MNSHECPPASKRCTDCGKKRPTSEFYVKRKLQSGADLLMAQCKLCYGKRSAKSYAKRREKKLAKCAEYRQSNAKQIKRYMASYYEANRGEILERSKAYQADPQRKQADQVRHAKRYSDNRAVIRAKQNAYNNTEEGRAKQKALYEHHYAANKEMFIARSAKRRAMKMQATPPWFKSSDALPFYRLAARLTRETGELHVVDHIVPLQGRNVCGLHVKANLQVLPAIANLRKFNRFG